AQGTVLLGNPDGGALTGGFGYTALGASVYFAASDGLLGRELWGSNGTTQRLVADIHPGPQGSSPSSLKAFGPVLLFRADDGTHGGELYKLPAGATSASLVLDIKPGSSGSSPQLFVVF